MTGFVLAIKYWTKLIYQRSDQNFIANSGRSYPSARVACQVKVRSNRQAIQTLIVKIFVQAASFAYVLL